MTNLRGITVAGLLQDTATSVVIVATLVVGILALVRSGHGLHTPLQPLHGHHPGDFLEAVALGVFLYSAFEWVTTSAEEVRKPSSINRGMLIAIGILCVVCAVATVAMSHTLSHHELTSAYPQLYLGIAALGPSGLWVMAAVTAVTALNTFNGGFITASRFIYGTAREGSLPRQLAQLNARAVPWVPVVALGGLSAVVALLVAVTHAWAVLVAVGAALEGMIYAVAGFCALRLRSTPARSAPPLPRAGSRCPRARRHRTVRPSGGPRLGLGAGPIRSPPRSAIILVACALSAFYVLRILPGMQGAGATRQAASLAAARAVSAASGDQSAYRTRCVRSARRRTCRARASSTSSSTTALERNSLGFPQHRKHGDRGEARAWCSPR